MNIEGKYVVIVDSDIRQRYQSGVFPIVGSGTRFSDSELNSNSNIIRYKNENDISHCYRAPAESRVNRAIIDWDRYQESNKDNIKTMLIGEDESARQLALEVLKQYNCVII